MELKEFPAWFWTVCGFRKGRDGSAQWMAAQARIIENQTDKTCSCRDFSIAIPAGFKLYLKWKEVFSSFHDKCCATSSNFSISKPAGTMKHGGML